MHTIRVIVHDRVQLKEKALGKKKKGVGLEKKEMAQQIKFSI